MQITITPGGAKMDSQTYYQTLAALVAELTRKAEAHEAEAHRYERLLASDDRFNAEAGPRAFRQEKAAENRRDAKLCRDRIDALQAGMACLTW